jgi:dihydrofolate synthase/folylpolyglutamate synthase
LEWIDNSPALLLDGAHNPAGAKVLRNFLNQFGLRPLTIVFGAMADKRIDEIAETLFPLADNLIITQVQNPRTATIDQIAATARRFTTRNIFSEPSASEALALAKRTNGDQGMICVTGSLYLIGEVRQLLIGKHDG